VCELRGQDVRTVVGHSQNRNLSDGSVTTLYTTSSLVDGGQIRVHVTGVSTATGHFFTGSGDLTKSIAVGGQVGKNDEDVLLELVGVVLGGGEGETGSNDTLDTITGQQSFLKIQAYLRRVVCQVQEQGNALHTAVLLEVLGEETTRLQVNTHGTEDNGEVVIVVVVYTLRGLSDQAGLSTNLRSNLVVRKTGGREDGDLLSTGNRVHRVDGRDTGRDHLFGVDLALSDCALRMYREYILLESMG
jgi:hypothetical protein